LNGSLDLEIPEYETNGTICNWMYFLNDGIHPCWAIFMKTIAQPVNDAEMDFSTKQEHSGKDVERGYGLLVKQSGILKKLICIWYRHNIAKLMKCCVIIHNMIVEHCRPIYKAVRANWDSPSEAPREEVENKED
jgi:hypothetical protein